MKNLKRFTEIVFLQCIGFVIGVIVGSIYVRNTTKDITPDTTIDSLICANDSIKLKVEELDSIKHAKVIEVSALNNDSTLKLFYKLVSE